MGIVDSFTSLKFSTFLAPSRQLSYIKENKMCESDRLHNKRNKISEIMGDPETLSRLQKS